METKNIMAKSSGSNLKISFKKSCEVAKELKNLKVDRALSYLESVRDLKVAVPYRRFNAELGHKKGKGVDTGGYPKNVAIGLITLIKSAKKNAIHLGLDEKNLRILSVIATKGMGRYIPGRYSGRKMKSTNVEVCLVEKEKEVKKKMIEKKIIQEIIAEHNIDKFLRSQLEGVPVDKILVEKNPAKGDQITIETSLPGLVIGREGSKIKELTLSLKEKFNMTNPQIKISEIKNPAINSKLVAKMISRDLTRFGSQKFKLTAFKYMTQALRNGAQGIEIRISGKLPSSRAKSWRFSKGYLKKTGYISDFVMEEAVDSANLKTGTLGIKVKILTDDIVLPDTITLIEDVEKIEKAKQDKKELQEKDREEFEQKMKERKMKFRKQKMEEAKK